MFTKRTRAVWALFCCLLLCLLYVSPIAFAQNYSFALRENVANVYINQDGTIDLVLDMTFANDTNADPIDVVDVGLPNNSYDVGQVRAWIDGTPLTDIEDSPYVDHGVAVELGTASIPPGQTGTLHVEATVRDLIYQDSKDDEYASLEFSPTWFDSQFVHGTTRVEVNFHLPPGVTSEEPRYHDEEFTSATFVDDRVVYTWIKEDGRGDRQYIYGASFPAKYLAEGVVQKAPAFNFNLNFAACCSSPVWWMGGFVAIWIGLAIAGNRSQKRRKMQYLPPSLAVEGSGIKRGLTAVEAAVLLEAPLNKIMTMVLFGLVKKGIVTVESEKPFKVTAQDPVPQDVKLWYYERRFLKAVKEDGTLKEIGLREMVIDLISDVNKKLTGFSRKETKEYYQDIAARAWKQVEAADTPQVLGKRWSEGLEWTMLEDDWDDRTRQVFHDRPVVMPHWWWAYRPWHASSSTPSSRPAMPRPAPSGGGTPVTLPTLPGAAFANTVVSGIENAANTVVSSVESFTSSVTETTNPPPKPSSSSSSRSGGYSCACACACAGCACACAGGGR